MNKETLTAIKDAKVAYDAAKRTGVGHAKKRTVLENILWSAIDEIIETAEYADHMTKCAIEDANTIRELKAKIAEEAKPVEKKKG